MPAIAISEAVIALTDPMTFLLIHGTSTNPPNGSHTNPNNDFLKTEAKLNEFASFTREVLDKIKASSAYNEILVHMAMPVACAFMLGHVWMPKADMKLILHDYYNNTENRAIIIE